MFSSLAGKKNYRCQGVCHPLIPYAPLRSSRHKTFRAAASELHVTAAAVIQQVKSLEEYLGRQLLRRDRRGYNLTPEGVAGLENLRTAFHQLSVAVDAMTSGGHRVLTVSAVPSLSAEWLVPRLRRFREKYPDIDVLLHPSEELVELENSRVDVGIRYGLGNYPGLISERLFVDEIFPVYSPRLLRRGKSIKPDDLRGYLSYTRNGPLGPVIGLVGRIGFGRRGLMEQMSQRAHAFLTVRWLSKPKHFVSLFQMRREYIFDPFHECADSARQVAPMRHYEGHGKRPAT